MGFTRSLFDVTPSTDSPVFSSSSKLDFGLSGKYTDRPTITYKPMNNCVVDAAKGVAKMAVATATPEVVRTWTSFKRQTNQNIAWRFGLKPDDLPGLVKANQGFAFDPAKVTAPALVVVSNGEYKSPEIKRQTMPPMPIAIAAKSPMRPTGGRFDGTLGAIREPPGSFLPERVISYQFY